MPRISKIINDPIHGFISLPNQIQFKLIEHPWFQRLRRIKQLGLGYLVYPAAMHVRFQHSLGAMHLMNLTLNHLISKGHLINDEERHDALNAILLHDIGHGPFSHTLENTIVIGMNHEQIGRSIIRCLNEELGGALNGAIQILEGRHPRKFLCQLVAGQMDMDRMDYLRRDSFYTGVAEGYINLDRLLAMLDIADDELVVEAKGIFTVEHFLAARRMMYWQVYLHKTVLSAEFMLSKAILRARYLIKDGFKLDASPSLRYFLENTPDLDDFAAEGKGLKHFTKLDDVDILAALKSWQNCGDLILEVLSSGILNRNLFKIILQEDAFDEAYLLELSQRIGKNFGIQPEESHWLLINGKSSNQLYNVLQAPIRVINKNGTLTDLHEVSPVIAHSGHLEPETKFFVCFPKTLYFGTL